MSIKEIRELQFVVASVCLRWRKVLISPRIDCAEVMLMVVLLGLLIQPYRQVVFEDLVKAIQIRRTDTAVAFG